MAESKVENTENLETETKQKNMESLQNISSILLKEENPTNLQLEQIVNNILDHIKPCLCCGDLNVDDITDLIMPKVKSELYSNDTLINDITNMKDSLNTYMQQMQMVDQDIADIYLDLHNIYRKLEKSDDGSRRLSSENREKLSRRVQESEELQKRSRHYLTNDAKELSAMLVKPPQEPNL
ncbi:hypothetical protein KR054_003160 [Drosophila jambulina]|nr:hypothetical protein KR054_003160 [Drosophila jambulina]